MKMTAKPIRITVLIFMLIFVLISGLGIAWSRYQNRCLVDDCSFASWEAILDLAFSHAGDDLRIVSIMAIPASHTDYTDIGPSFINIEIEYTSIKPYSSKSIRFDDKTLIVSSWRNEGEGASLPSSESQEILKKVTVHPRDAFRMTWQLAQNKLAFDPTNSRIAAVLRFDCGPQNDGCKPIWEVYYYRGAGPVYEAGAVYVVNAQTGEVVSVDNAP